MTEVQKNRLSEQFFNRPAPDVARELLGKFLVHGEQRGAIIETEAYMAVDDAASHYGQQRKRAREAFAGGAGTIYIHFNHGRICMDFVAGNGSVLIRALNLPGANGPNKLLRVLGITRDFHTRSVVCNDSPIWLEQGAADGETLVGARVRVTQAQNLPLRFRMVMHSGQS